MKFILLATALLLFGCSSDKNNTNNQNNVNNANNTNNSNNTNNANNIDDVGTLDMTTIDSGPDLSVDTGSDTGNYFSGVVNMFELPTGALRYGTAMVLPDEGVTVSLIWFGGQYPLCEDGFTEFLPEVYVEQALNPMAWSLTPNGTYANADGCVDFEGIVGTENMIDLKLDITSDVWSGPVHFKSP